MRRNGKETSFPKSIVLIVAVFIICFGMIAAAPKQHYASPVKHSPFKMLKIGTKNLTKAVNKGCYMGEFFDGCLELHLGDYRGTVINGKSRLKYRLKNGYKAKFSIYNGNSKRLLKNHGKISWSSNEWGIYLTVSKGNNYVNFGFLPSSEYDEYD